MVVWVLVGSPSVRDDILCWFLSPGFYVTGGESRAVAANPQGSPADSERGGRPHCLSLCPVGEFLVQSLFSDEEALGGSWPFIHTHTFFFPIKIHIT